MTTGVMCDRKWDPLFFQRKVDSCCSRVANRDRIEGSGEYFRMWDLMICIFLKWNEGVDIWRPKASRRRNKIPTSAFRKMRAHFFR